MDIETVRLLVAEGNYVGTTHFYERLDERKIDLEQVKTAIATGFILEERPKEKPHPKMHDRGFCGQEFWRWFLLSRAAVCGCCPG